MVDRISLTRRRKRHARGPNFFLPIDRDYLPQDDERNPVYCFKPIEREFGGSKKLSRLFGRDKNRSVIRRILLRRFYYSETRESADGKCHKVKYVASVSQLVFFPLHFFFRAHISDCYRSLYVYVCTGCPQKVSKHS